MKRLILLLFVAFLGLATFAQEIVRPSTTTYNTFSRNPQSGDYSYWNYNGTSSDLLIPTTSDTIHIQYHVKKYRPYTLKVMSKFDPIAGADTIVYINVYGRNSTDESWSSILTDSSAVVDADGVTKTVSTATSPTFTATIAAFNVTKDAYNLTTAAHVLLTDTTGLSGYPADSISVPSYTIAVPADTLAFSQQTISLAQTSTLLEYSYILVEYIIGGDDSVGTGIELKRSELKLFEH